MYKKYINLIFFVFVLFTKNTQIGAYNDFNQDTSTKYNSKKSKNKRDLYTAVAIGTAFGVGVSSRHLASSQQDPSNDQELINNLKKQIQQQKNLKLSISNEKQGPQNKISELKDQQTLNQSNNTIESLNNQLTSKKKELEKHKKNNKQQVTNLNQQLQDQGIKFETQLKESKDSLENKNSEKIFLENKNNELVEENKQLQELKTKAEEQALVSNNTIKALNKELGNLTQKITSLKQDNKDKQEQVKKTLLRESETALVNKKLYKQVKKLSKQIQSLKKRTLNKNNLPSSIVLVEPVPKNTNLSDSIVLMERSDQIESKESQEACTNLYNWLNNQGISSSNTQQIVKQIIKGCNFYSTKTKQNFSEGTFCLSDPKKTLTNYFYNNKEITNRRSSHLKSLETKEHKGIDLSEPITIGDTKKRTLLIIAYTTINGENMLLIKPENAPVFSKQHVCEYLFPPKGTNLPDRKERIIPITALPNGKKFNSSIKFKEGEYKKYGISYLHKNNYFDQKIAIKKYLKENKLDCPEIRIGKEVIITPENLEKPSI